MQEQLKGWLGVNRFSNTEKQNRAPAVLESEIEGEKKNAFGVPIHHIFTANEELIDSLFNSQKEVSADAFLHDLTHSECEYWRLLRLCLMNDLTLFQQSDNAATGTETVNSQVSSKTFIFSILKKLNPNVHRSESIESKREESQQEMLVLNEMSYEIDIHKIDTEIAPIDKDSVKDGAEEEPAELHSDVIEGEDVKSNKEQESSPENADPHAAGQNDEPKVFVTMIEEPPLAEAGELKNDKQELDLASVKVNKPEHSTEHLKENGDGSQAHPGSSKHEQSEPEKTRKRYKKSDKKDDQSEHSEDKQKDTLTHRDRKPDYKFYNNRYRRDDYSKQDYNDRNSSRRHSSNLNNSRNSRDNRDQNDNWRDSRNEDYRSKRHDAYDERKFNSRQRN